MLSYTLNISMIIINLDGLAVESGRMSRETTKSCRSVTRCLNRRNTNNAASREESALRVNERPSHILCPLSSYVLPLTFLHIASIAQIAHLCCPSPATPVPVSSSTTPRWLEFNFDIFPTSFAHSQSLPENGAWK